MAELSKDIAAYDRLRHQLETDHFGEWVIVHDERLVGVFRDFQEAAAEAVRRFGRGPYLIRRVGAPPLTLPRSVMYSAA
ncbi:MAG: hypothetical protein F4X26_01450 [Chloroflexi bacterium]|nr:hypothetical protein [Chloroflexota bacterium]